MVGADPESDHDRHARTSAPRIADSRGSGRSGVPAPADAEYRALAASTTSPAGRARGQPHKFIPGRSLLQRRGRPDHRTTFAGRSGLFTTFSPTLEGPNDGLVSVESALGFGTPLPNWPVDHLRQMNWLAPPRSLLGPAVTDSTAMIVDNLAAQGSPSKDRLPRSIRRRAREAAFIQDEAGSSCSTRSWTPSAARRSVKQNGDGHVSEDVGGGPATVEEPVDRQQDGDLVRREARRRQRSRVA